jgi:TolA-binding protein
MSWKTLLCSFIIAIVLFASGRCVDARNLSEEEQLIQVGIGAYQDGFYDIAEKQFSRFVRDFPRHAKSPEVYYLLAKTYFIRERFAESRTAFQKAIADGRQVESLDYALLGLAEAEIRLDDLEGAKRTLLALSQRFPKSEWIDQVYYRLGLIELGANRLASARQFLQRIPALTRKTDLLRSSSFWLGVLTYRQNDFEAAAGYFRTALEDGQSPSDAEGYGRPALFWLAEAQTKLGRFQDAKSNYQLFSERYRNDPRTPDVLWRIAYCEYRAGRPQVALERFQSFKVQFKDSKWTAHAHFVAGIIHLSLGNYSASLSEFNSVLDRSTSQELTGVSLLALYWNRTLLGERDEANRISQRLLKSPHFQEEKNLSQWMMAEATFSEGRGLDSLPFYFNIINSRFRETALLRIGKSYFFEGQSREAATNFDILLLEFPNSLYSDECLFLKAESLFRLGELGPALAALDPLTQKRAAPAWQLLAIIQTANIHLLRNAGDAAESFFKQAVELFPNHPLSYYAAFQLGNLYFLKKNVGEAMNFYSLVLKGNVLEFLGEAYFRMGEIFYQQEKYEKALKNFETAIQHLKDTSPWFFLTQLEIGNLQRRWGKYEEAKKSYRIILDQSQDEDIRKAARELLVRLESRS